MELGNMSSLYTGLLTTQNTTGTKLKETVNNADYSAASEFGINFDRDAGARAGSDYV